MKNRAGPSLRSISVDLCSSEAWTDIFLNNTMTMTDTISCHLVVVRGKCLVDFMY